MKGSKSFRGLDMNNSWKIFGMGIVIFWGISPALADKAWDTYLGLNPTQRGQLKMAGKTRGNMAKPAREDKDAATQTLMTQVLANAGDSTLQPILTQILGDIKTMDGAEDSFWQAIQSFLSPTQVAKIFLKGHPPKNTAQNPPPPKPANPQPPFNWNAYFGFTKDQQIQLKAADQQKNTQVKPTQEEKEAAIQQLSQLVQTNAPDTSIQPTLTTLFNDIETEYAANQAFWGTTLPGFLSPTQMAKLYLHRHPPQGGFHPPAPVAVKHP
jgi:hypothetical protein